MPPAPVLIAAALAGIAWYLGDQTYHYVLIPVAHAAAHAAVHAGHFLRHIVQR